MTDRSLPHLRDLVSHVSDRTSGRAIARMVMISSGLFNAGLVVASLLQRKYDAAATQTILVTLLATWCWLTPKVDGYLDARLAEAIARQKTAELALAEFERLQRAGLLRVGVTTQARADRMH